MGLVVLSVLSLGVVSYAVAVYGFLLPGSFVRPDMREMFEAKLFEACLNPLPVFGLQRFS